MTAQQKIQKVRTSVYLDKQLKDEAKELFKKACYGGNQIGCNAYKILTSHGY